MEIAPPSFVCCFHCRRMEHIVVAIGHDDMNINWVWLCRDCVLLALMAFEEVTDD